MITTRAMIESPNQTSFSFAGPVLLFDHVLVELGNVSS
jgi:hypothetical protein